MVHREWSVIALSSSADPYINVVQREAIKKSQFLCRYLTSPDNRHALPLFTSLLNTVCSYDPVGLGLPYNHLLFSDTLEPLVEVSLHLFQ